MFDFIWANSNIDGDFAVKFLAEGHESMHDYLKDTSSWGNIQRLELFASKSIFFSWTVFTLILRFGLLFDISFIVRAVEIFLFIRFVESV